MLGEPHTALNKKHMYIPIYIYIYIYSLKEILADSCKHTDEKF